MWSKVVALHKNWHNDYTWLHSDFEIWTGCDWVMHWSVQPIGSVPRCWNGPWDFWLLPWPERMEAVNSSRVSSRVVLWCLVVMKRWMSCHRDVTMSHVDARNPSYEMVELKSKVNILDPSAWIKNQDIKRTDIWTMNNYRLTKLCKKYHDTLILQSLQYTSIYYICYPCQRVQLSSQNFWVLDWWSFIIASCLRKVLVRKHCLDQGFLQCPWLP